MKLVTQEITEYGVTTVWISYDGTYWWKAHTWQQLKESGRVPSKRLPIDKPIDIPPNTV